ncbi:MAG: rRNA maturation RNase YbeY [Deltaproteobacteria bacterium]|nr:rRNA maturation RNase YbeY [Deltaproteobacteria bacterium]
MVQELQIEEKAKKPIEINLSFITDQEMKKMNHKHRGINQTTDILSFPMDELEDAFPVVCLGDLIISVERTQIQAQERNHSFGVELKHLLVHGLLHLLGYEHKKNPDPMRKLELKLLKKTKNFEFEAI